MTAIMIFIAFNTQTPPTMWVTAMLCDTAMIVTYLILNGVS